MKKVIIAILLFALICAVDARMPQKGDYVKIVVNQGNNPIGYIGNITDVGNGLITLNCSNCITPTSYGFLESMDIEYPFDVCIGSGAIINLRWI